jgi:hypothetical protein
MYHSCRIFVKQEKENAMDAILSLALAIALLLLALEHFGVPVPSWLTGIFLILAAIIQFL